MCLPTMPPVRMPSGVPAQSFSARLPGDAGLSSVVSSTEGHAAGPAGERLAVGPVPRLARGSGISGGGVHSLPAPDRPKPLRPPGPATITPVADRSAVSLSAKSPRIKPLKPTPSFSAAAAMHSITGAHGSERATGSEERQPGRNPRAILTESDEPGIGIHSGRSRQQGAASPITPATPAFDQPAQERVRRAQPLLHRIDREIEPFRPTLERPRFPTGGVRVSDPVRAFGLLNHIDDPSFDGAAATLGFPPERLLAAHAILIAHPEDRKEIFALLRQTVLNEDGAVADVALFDHYRVALEQVLRDGSVASRVDATLNLLNRFSMTSARKALTDTAPNGVLGRGRGSRSRTGSGAKLAVGSAKQLRTGLGAILERRFQFELTRQLGPEVTISARTAVKGKSEAIFNFRRLGESAPENLLSPRQTRILERLAMEGDRVVVPRKDAKLGDIVALTAATNVEFALFTRGPQRLIVRGSERRVPVTLEDARRMASQGWRWSGHTHPGVSRMVLQSSPGDRLIVAEFPHPLSVIYNSIGTRQRFNKDGDVWEFN